MRTLLSGLVLLALPALGDDGVASIRLYTHFQQAPPAAVLDSIRDEVTRIMSPMGLAFNWTPMAENRGNEVAVKVAVIHFTGQCDMVQSDTLAAHSGALGWTYLEDGTILPFSDIDCDAIWTFLRNDLLARPEEEREESLGRAIGRVLAHELYHIFVNTTRHSSQGIAKPYYSAQELLSRSFQFEQKESDELRRYGSDVATGGF